MAVKLPLFFAEMLFEQKKALNHVKQMILEQKLKKLICPLQLVLALGALEPFLSAVSRQQQFVSIRLVILQQAIWRFITTN